METLLYIEHSGTEKHNSLVKDIEDYLFINFGIEVKEIIKTVPNITLYDKNLNKIIEISNFYSLKQLGHFVDFLIRE
ncbi:MAG: hypothetical protein N2485_08300 [bacterium]|nr:hypothetical protein [bacterium]